MSEAERRSFCDYLRRAREARRMSLVDVSRVTKIRLPVLENLEAGDFESLPAPVFVRGFVRSYARCVGLDADDALGRLAACGGFATSRPGSVFLILQGADDESDDGPARGNGAGNPSAATAWQGEHSDSLEGEDLEREERTPRLRLRRRRAQPSRAAGRRPETMPGEVVLGRANGAGIPADRAAAGPGLEASREVNAAQRPSHGSLVRPPVLVIDDDNPELAVTGQVQQQAPERARTDESRRALSPSALRDKIERSLPRTLAVAVIVLAVAAMIAMNFLLRPARSSGEATTTKGPAASTPPT